MNANESEVVLVIVVFEHRTRSSSIFTTTTPPPVITMLIVAAVSVIISQREDTQVSVEECVACLLNEISISARCVCVSYLDVCVLISSSSTLFKYS